MSMANAAVQRARTLGEVQRDDRSEEGRQFTRDVFDRKPCWSGNGVRGRLEIDAFTFRRYEVLGWIQEIENFPYYQLTANGEAIYWKHYAEVDPDRLWLWGEEQ